MEIHLPQKGSQLLFEIVDSSVKKRDQVEYDNQNCQLQNQTFYI